MAAAVAALPTSPASCPGGYVAVVFALYAALFLAAWMSSSTSWTPMRRSGGLCGALLAAFFWCSCSTRWRPTSCPTSTCCFLGCCADDRCRACLALWKRGRSVLNCSSRACITCIYTYTYTDSAP